MNKPVDAILSKAKLIEKAQSSSADLEPLRDYSVLTAYPVELGRILGPGTFDQFSIRLLTNLLTALTAKNTLTVCKKR